MAEGRLLVSVISPIVDGLINRAPLYCLTTSHATNHAPTISNIKPTVEDKGLMCCIHHVVNVILLCFAITLELRGRRTSARVPGAQQVIYTCAALCYAIQFSCRSMFSIISEASVYTDK